MVSGRHHAENERLVELAREGDLLFEVRDVGSPVTLLRGEADAESIEIAAAITARYSDAGDPLVVVRFGTSYPDLPEAVTVEPAGADLLEQFRV